MQNAPFVGLCRIAGLPTGSYVVLWGILMSNRLISVAVTTFIVAASGSAFAADMAVKAPAAAPAPVYNWTGWYVGVNAGGSFGTDKTDFNVAPSSLVAVAPTITGSPFTATIPGFAGRDEVYPGGFIGGGQIGFNWQLSPPMGRGT
jgi:outer membrane immunogenic protein